MKGEKDNPRGRPSRKLDETHIVCEARLVKEGGKATCCYCDPHKGCTLKKATSDFIDNSTDMTAGQLVGYINELEKRVRKLEAKSS